MNYGAECEALIPERTLQLEEKQYFLACYTLLFQPPPTLYLEFSIYFIFMHMGILPVCMCVHHVCAVLGEA